MTVKKTKLLLFTIGYEKAKSDAVLRELAAAKVDILVDVRAVAASRRPGFYKRQLDPGAGVVTSRADVHYVVSEHGIAYLHLRVLGTPKEGRLAARAGNLDELFRIFEAHLKTAPAQEELDELTTLIRSGRRVCLLCYERDVAHCHRSRLAGLMHERTGVRIENLIPRLF